jgi:hypothetical protein
MTPDFLEIYWITVRHFNGRVPRLVIMREVLKAIKARG